MSTPTISTTTDTLYSGQRSLANLPVEILYLIRDSLVDASGRYRDVISVPRVEDHFPHDSASAFRGEHPLHALSATCRSLRSICLPSLFQHITLDRDADASLPAPSILPYVRALRYFAYSVGRDVHRKHIDLIRNMRNLAQIRCYGYGHEVLSDNLDLPFAAAALDSLLLENIHLTDESVSIHHPTSPLRVFKLYFHNRFTVLATIPSAELDAENRRLEPILDYSRHRMEEMVLPGEATRLSFLSRSQWHGLRTLVLCGTLPILDVPFVDVLLAMPRLGSLTLSVAPRVGTAPLVIWPALADRTPNLDLRNLHHFAIAYPAETDMVFAHLTSNLKTLALRDMPRYYARKLQLLNFNRTTSLQAYAAPILTYASAARIFEIFNGSDLERLELVVFEDDAEAQTLRRIARCCPNLRFFELHRYRVEPDEWQALSVVPVAHIAQCLAIFSSLHTLRVHLDFPLGLAGHSPYRDWEAWDCFVDAQAQTLADSLPWLKRIAILCADRRGVTVWTTWSAHLEDDGRVTLLRDAFDWNCVEEVWM
ncbi:hypothetical protein EXIGLDRAFT_828896 [Exidia glandulosa HHB12029]|uniref:F-box domain-containing protein n=1 Tax=Exidia glandulosa HHB12029 TaxID=1314781 RepID=A0A165PWC8_EXIGL|nr:hypothetical protein EXIGLDRAFT_828896 [Exidia glandulosa HHB12029]